MYYDGEYSDKAYESVPLELFCGILSRLTFFLHFLHVRLTFNILTYIIRHSKLAVGA